MPLIMRRSKDGRCSSVALALHRSERGLLLDVHRRFLGRQQLLHHGDHLPGDVLASLEKQTTASPSPQSETVTCTCMVFLNVLFCILAKLRKYCVCNAFGVRNKNRFELLF